MQGEAVGRHLGPPFERGLDNGDRVIDLVGERPALRLAARSIELTSEHEPIARRQEWPELWLVKPGHDIGTDCNRKVCVISTVLDGGVDHRIHEAMRTRRYALPGDELPSRHPPIGVDDLALNQPRPMIVEVPAGDADPPIRPTRKSDCAKVRCDPEAALSRDQHVVVRLVHGIWIADDY
ncbi:MAG: hypothetical protein KY443_11350 [Actinobacteria bacterium]|nr:hypothetical protein [Actinomycetota bacterium]